MTNAHIELFVAARGWSNPAWFGDFYPDDLPEDWRLSFYSNEFRAVVVPASEWIDLDVAEIERWKEDTSEEFLFYLEVENLLTDWNKSATLCHCLGDQLGGILLRPSEVDADLAMLSSTLKQASALTQVSLFLPDGVELSAIGEGLLKQYGVERSWIVGEGTPRWIDPGSDSGLAVACVTGNKTFTARQWRETIEICLQQLGAGSGTAENRAVLLMIESDESQMANLRTAMMIGDMLVRPSSLL